MNNFYVEKTFGYSKKNKKKNKKVKYFSNEFQLFYKA